MGLENPLLFKQLLVFGLFGLGFVSALIVFWRMAQRASGALQALDAMKQQHTILENFNRTWQEECEDLRAQIEQHVQKRTEAEVSLQAECVRTEEGKKREAELQARYDQLQMQYDALQSSKQQLETERSNADLLLQEKDKQLKSSMEAFEETRKQMKNEFENLANSIFEKKQQQFSDTSQKSMDSLIKPLREQLESFRRRVDDVHTDSVRSHATMRSEIGKLRDLNMKITEDASKLTRALKGNKKMQGSWGEMQVEMILDQSGLVKGREYYREMNYKDDASRNLRPDVVVNLPDGKHIIIDSKVSLNDYLRYANAESETERHHALQCHVKAVKAHIDNLSSKNYTDLGDLNSPDFALMFMPIEPAFICAFEYDQALYNWAFEKRVVVVTPTTLLATLRTVANIWSIERQNQNARELAVEASKVHKKLSVFANKMKKVGEGLRRATEEYNSACISLSGQRGLYSHVGRFVEHGVRVESSLPEMNVSIPGVEDAVLEKALEVEESEVV